MSLVGMVDWECLYSASAILTFFDISNNGGWRNTLAKFWGTVGSNPHDSQNELRVEVAIDNFEEHRQH
jgi:hypothetical protein